jgi:hypothetical protein
MAEGEGETCPNMGEMHRRRNQEEDEEEVTFIFPIVDPTANIQMKNISPSHYHTFMER